MLLIIFLGGCALATIVTLSATILSSRIKHNEASIEMYEEEINYASQQFLSRTYPVEVTAR